MFIDRQTLFILITVSKTQTVLTECSILQWCSTISRYSSGTFYIQQPLLAERFYYCSQVSPPLQATKTLRVSRGIALFFLGPRHQIGVGVSAPRPDRLYPQERPGTHCIGGWVGPRAGLDRCEESRSHRDSIPELCSPQPVAIPSTLPGPRFYTEFQCFKQRLVAVCCSFAATVLPNMYYSLSAKSTQVSQTDLVLQ